MTARTIAPEWPSRLTARGVYVPDQIKLASDIINKTFFTPKVAQMVLEGYLGRPSKENEGDSNRQNGLRLTSRQKQILQLLAEGRSSREVAVALNISVKTAETHRANIMRRLDCHSVTELVRYAIRNHIIEA